MIPGAPRALQFRAKSHTVGMEPNDEESAGSIPIHSVDVESEVAMPTKPEPSQAEAVAESSETSDRTPESSSEHLPDALSGASPFSPKALRRHLNTFAERTISMVRLGDRPLAGPWRPRWPAHRSGSGVASHSRTHACTHFPPRRLHRTCSTTWPGRTAGRARCCCRQRPRPPSPTPRETATLLPRARVCKRGRLPVRQVRASIFATIAADSRLLARRPHPAGLCSV